MHIIVTPVQGGERKGVMEMLPLFDSSEKLNIRVVDPAVHSGLPSSEERGEIERAQKENRQRLAIPRRYVYM